VSIFFRSIPFAMSMVSFTLDLQPPMRIARKRGIRGRRRRRRYDMIFSEGGDE
jgi:hypothetical protein